MKEEQKEFFDIMTSFRKLNISTMLPDINHGDFGILKMIDYCSERSRGKSVKVSTVVRCKNSTSSRAVSRSLRSFGTEGIHYQIC